MPIYLTSAGRPDLINDALLALNFGQLPASALLLLTAARPERLAWPYVAAGGLSMVSIIGFVMMPGPAAVVWAGILGFAAGGALTLALTLPALLCARKTLRARRLERLRSAIPARSSSQSLAVRLGI